MLTFKPRLTVGARVANSAIVLSGMLALPAIAQDTYLGSREFAVSCAVCHGTTGKGDGEMAKLLTVKPADLTVLTKKNGGEFPSLRVFEVIDGRSQVSGHGDRVMPIWGDRYEAEIEGSAKHQLLGTEVMVSSRINDLVHYLASIQEK
jgi:mono/diheme cytochrome c family protein